MARRRKNAGAAVRWRKSKGMTIHKSLQGGTDSRGVKWSVDQKQVSRKAKNGETVKLTHYRILRDGVLWKNKEGKVRYWVTQEGVAQKLYDLLHPSSGKQQDRAKSKFVKERKAKATARKARKAKGTAKPSASKGKTTAKRVRAISTLKKEMEKMSKAKQERLVKHAKDSKWQLFRAETGMSMQEASKLYKHLGGGSSAKPKTKANPRRRKNTGTSRRRSSVRRLPNPADLLDEWYKETGGW